MADSATDRAVTFYVLGLPAPAGSKRALPLGGKANGRAIVVDANPRARQWKQAVAVEAARAWQGRDPISGPVRVQFTFYRPRPRSHYGTGRNADKLKDSAPMYPTGRPDALKLARGVEDACTHILWNDDAQIVSEKLLKRWGNPPGVEVWVERL